MPRLRHRPMTGKGEGIRVIAELEAPLEAGFGTLHLDGMLTYMVKRSSQERYTGEGPPPPCPLPLRSVRGVWAATAAIDPHPGDFELEWWCFGHRPAVRRIRQLRTVGADRIPVVRWSVRPDRDIRLEHCFALRGVAMRNIPAQWCVEPEGVVTGNVTPPYWLESQSLRIVPAGSAAVLRPEVLAEGALR